MSALSVLLARLPYVVAVLLVGLGLVTVVDDEHLVRKVVGLNVFQTGIFLFLVAAAVRRGGRSPNVARPGPYVDPVPQVLVLTAIVVGVSVTGVALALVVRIYYTYGSLREETVRAAMAAEGSGPSSTDREHPVDERSDERRADEFPAEDEFPADEEAPVDDEDRPDDDRLDTAGSGVNDR